MPARIMTPFRNYCAPPLHGHILYMERPYPSHRYNSDVAHTVRLYCRMFSTPMTFDVDHAGEYHSFYAGQMIRR